MTKLRMVLLAAGALAAVGGAAAACSPAPVEPEQGQPLPVVFVHGGAGSAAEFETQALRFTSNGFPAERIAAFEYDSTLSLQPLTGIHQDLEELVNELRQDTGADQVHIVGHGLGTFVVQTYLNSSDERAAAVAGYANVDGSSGGTVPEGIETLAVWGEDNPHGKIEGATNVHFRGRSHRDVMASRQTFERLFRHVTGDRPRSTRVVPQRSDRVVLEGRAVVHPFNVGLDGATLEIYRVGRRGERFDGEPVATFPLKEDGAWGPFEVDRTARYEFAILRESVETQHVRRGPFVRSDHLVRLRAYEPDPSLGEAMVEPLTSSAGYLGTPGADAVPSPAAQSFPGGCEGPVPDPDPGTRPWFERDANNLYCTQQRHLDKASHPSLSADDVLDPYREPSQHDGARFRFDSVTIAGLDAEVYRPCAPDSCPDLPDSLDAIEPPYPAVITLHGGGSNKELHRWSSQSLAEAGYLTIAFDGASEPNARAVLDWLFAGDDPLASAFDGEHVGVAGHSIGGDAAAALAHGDPRVSAAVYWDRAGLTSPDVSELTVPSLGLISDYGCTAPLVCPLELRRELPDPADRGAKTQDFDRLREAGIDTMQVALRGTTHFDWVPNAPSGNRYGELLSVYYTRAWFDRYLKGADDPKVARTAYKRLTAPVFDTSADRHNISQGFWDPVDRANVPYALEGMSVSDRLSFYYPSKCYVTVPGREKQVESEDMRRQGCR